MTKTPICDSSVIAKPPLKSSGSTQQDQRGGEPQQPAAGVEGR